MSILSLSEVSELKRLAAEYGYNIHVCDACGGQSFNLETSGANADEGVYAAIEQFFAQHNMSVHYYGNDKLQFVAK